MHNFFQISKNGTNGKTGYYLVCFFCSLFFNHSTYYGFNNLNGRMFETFFDFFFSGNTLINLGVFLRQVKALGKGRFCRFDLICEASQLLKTSRLNLRIRVQSKEILMENFPA